jgi:hypothetical protein
MSMATSSAPAAARHSAAPSATPAAAGPASAATNGGVDSFAALLEGLGQDAAGIAADAVSGAATNPVTLDAAQEPEESDPPTWPAGGDALFLLAPATPLPVPMNSLLPSLVAPDCGQSTPAPIPPQTHPGASMLPNPPAASGPESGARTAALGAAAADNAGRIQTSRPARPRRVCT